MAATLIPLRSTGIRACADSGHRKPEPDRRRTSSANWWTPLFGISSEPDYINSNSKAPTLPQAKAEGDPALKAAARPRFAGALTEEKARQLRMMTTGTETFHDTMYHSAIASRLASEFKANSDL
ncbi:uncharacterized protein LOC130715610 [Lotus japonicus]|uniref:uncharacterized protein LOC130715610 n=1 Tax=Lotus japonicus TaxID=34305 RepID=UPI002587729A|nr:uncharacterized protein LOC130715610 [Lotus japonicus]